MRKTTLTDAALFFVFGFEKNEKANVSAAELEALQALAAELLALSTKQLIAAVEAGAFREICHECWGQCQPDCSSPPRVTTPALVSAASATVCTMPSAARQPKLQDRLRKDLCARHYGNRIYKADGR